MLRSHLGVVFVAIATAELCRVFVQTFTDFELEAHLECAYDRVEVYDGDDASAPLIGRFCGSTRPRPDTVVAQGSRLYMTFSSDASVQRKGFNVLHSTGLSTHYCHMAIYVPML